MRDICFEHERWREFLMCAHHIDLEGVELRYACAEQFLLFTNSKQVCLAPTSSPHRVEFWRPSTNTRSCIRSQPFIREAKDAFVARYGGRLLGGAPKQSGVSQSASSSFDDVPPEEVQRFRGEPENLWNYRAYGAALLQAVIPATLNGLNHGYEFGAASAVVMNLRKHGPVWGHDLVGAKLGQFLSAFYCGEVCAGIVAYMIGDRISPKNMLVIAGIHHAVSGMFYLGAPNFEMFLLARFLNGAGTALGLIAAPQYIAEISPSEVRGAMVSLKEAMIVVGLTAGSIVGVAMVGVEGGYHWMPALGTIPIALTQTIGVLVLSPESPHYLIRMGFHHDALESLRKVRPLVADEALQEELQSISSAVATSEEVVGLKEMITNPDLRRCLLSGTSVAWSQSMTGHPALLVLSTKVFNALGTASAQHAQMVTSSFMFTKVALSFVGVELADRIGRRPQLLCGIVGMSISYLLMWVGFLSAEGSQLRLLIGTAGFFFSAMSYQLSLGPLTWVINSEIYPSSCRTPAISISLLVSFAGNVVASFLIPTIMEKFGFATAFFGLALACVKLGICCHLFVFESAGKSLEEIEQPLVEEDVFLLTGQEDERLE